MFDIGFLELLIIGVVGLLVLGPERLPKAARTAGLWIGKIKRSVSGMQREISAQLEAEELRQKLNEQQKKLDESVNKVKRGVEGVAEPTPEKTPSDERDASHSEQASQQDTSPSPEQRLDDALANARLDTPGDTRAETSSADKDASSR